MALSVKSCISFGKSDLENSTSTKTFTCSKKYIRQLLKFSVINIMYNRITLPEEEFEEDTVRDIQLVKCKKSSKHPLIYKYYEWMKGATDALEKDYLKEFYLLFKNTDGALLEFFRFKFYYNFNGVDKENRISHVVLYKTTKQIFEDIKCLSVYKKWDENNIFTAQIKYNDNVAPSYQPPYYVNCNPTDETEDEDEQAIKKIQERTDIFKVTTGFHTLKCLFGGDNSFSVYTTAPVSTTSTSIADEEEKTKQVDEREPETPLINVTILSSPAASSNKTEILKEEKFCICQTTVKHNALKLVHCVSCQKPFHSVCFGFFEVPKGDFKCAACGGSTNIPDETAVTADDTLLFIRLRLLIGFCNLTMETPDKIMAGFQNVQERNHLWKKLVDLKVILKKNKKYIVNRSKLTHVNSHLTGMFCEQIDADSMEMVDLTEEDNQIAGPLVKKVRC